MRRILDSELIELPFGSQIKTIWHNSKYHLDKDEYIGVVFGDKIGWADGKVDDIRIIAESIFNDWCMTYLM